MVEAKDRLAYVLSRVSFAEDLGFVLDDWQAALLRSTFERVLMNCARQSGKSTMAALLAVHTALFEPGSLTLLLSPTLRQSQELFRKCLSLYRQAGKPVEPESETALTLTLANGSRIVSLPGQESNVRGYSNVRLLAIDEAARVPDELYASVRPMLAVSQGKLVALSTPFGTRGWWCDAWRGEEPWERYEIPATEVPRISPEFLDEERRTLGEWWFEQEYMCRFLDAETQVFRREDVDAMFEEEVQPWVL